MRVSLEGELPLGLTAKDAILGTIGQIGVAGGVGHVLEYAGPVVRALSMEGRMTICNMSNRGRARAGMVAPDDITFAYLEGRPGAPSGAAWERALDEWRQLPSDEGAVFDREVEIDVRELAPQVTWGTNPGMVRAGRRTRARPVRPRGPRRPGDPERAARLHGPSSRGRRSLTSPSTACSSGRARTPGSRTSGSLRQSSRADRPPAVRAMVVPGRLPLRRQAEEEGLDAVFQRRASSGVAPGARCAWG